MSPRLLPSRALTTAALAAAAVLALAACTSGGAPDADATPVEGGTLTYATGDAEPTCLDPHVGGNYPQALVATQYAESLVSTDSDGAIIPWLATEWQVADDGLSWTFTLRDDVSFTDGTPFDAEAVAANVAHVQDPTTLSSTGYLALAKVTGVEAVDEHTARFDLSAPDSALLESLSQPWLAMESPEALGRSQEENCESPIGTGPFVVDEWTKQQQITFTRNDDYVSPPADAGHDGPAHLESVVWRFIPDSAARYAALQAGQVDVIDNAQPDTLVAAASDDQLTEIDAPRPGASNRLELNSGKAPFDDERVREAFIRGIDVDDAIDSLFFGTAERSYSPLSSVEPLGVRRPVALRGRRRRGGRPARRGRLVATRLRRLPHEGRHAPLPDLPGQHEPVDPRRAVALRADPGGREDPRVRGRAAAARPVELVRRPRIGRLRPGQRPVHEGRTRRAAHPVRLVGHHARAERVLRQPRAALRPGARRPAAAGHRRRPIPTSGPTSTSRRSKSSSTATRCCRSTTSRTTISSARR